MSMDIKVKKNRQYQLSMCLIQKAPQQKGLEKLSSKKKSQINSKQCLFKSNVVSYAN